MCLGIPGRIVRVWEDNGIRMADVDFGGAVKDVCLAYLPDAAIGDYTIVHAGFGLTKLDEASALESLRMFQELGMLEDELGIPSTPIPPGSLPSVRGPGVPEAASAPAEPQAAAAASSSRPEPSTRAETTER